MKPQQDSPGSGVSSASGRWEYGRMGSAQPVPAYRQSRRGFGCRGSYIRRAWVARGYRTRGQVGRLLGSGNLCLCPKFRLQDLSLRRKRFEKRNGGGEDHGDGRCGFGRDEHVGELWWEYSTDGGTNWWSRCWDVITGSSSDPIPVCGEYSARPDISASVHAIAGIRNASPGSTTSGHRRYVAPGPQGRRRHKTMAAYRWLKG